MPPIHTIQGPYPKERRYRRFELQLPVSLKLPAREAVRELKAISKNVSIGGLLLNTPDYIPLHTQLTFSMDVQSRASSRQVRLLGKGQVVRVEALGPGSGFAVAVACQDPISDMESHFSAAS